MATAQECCEWCGNTTSCTAFTHNEFNGHGAHHCYLKKSCTKSKRSGKRSVFLECFAKIPHRPPPLTPPGKCVVNYSENTDCQGNDLKSMQKDSVDDCCAECSETSGISVFVFNTADGHGQNWCCLKSGCKKRDRVRTRGCTAGVGILPQPGQRRRRAPGPKPGPKRNGCCSWAEQRLWQNDALLRR